MYRADGYVKFKLHGFKFYKAVTIAPGRRRYSRATFKRATDALFYSHMLEIRINRLLNCQEKGSCHE